MEYHVEELGDSNAADWDHVNEIAEDGSFCHSLKWKEVLERTFGYQARYFLVYRDHQPIALFPLYKTKIKWFSGLTTLPMSVYDHILVTDKQDPMIIEQALSKIKDLMKREELCFANLGLTAEMKNYFPDLSATLFTTGGNMVLNLRENSTDKIWTSLSYNQRSKIRRFEKDGFTVHEADSTEELNTFFRYCAKHMNYVNTRRRQSSDKQWYPTGFKFEHELIRVYKNEVVVARYNPTSALSWYGVRRASEMGFSTFCFGDTQDDPNSIHYITKAKFGAQFQRKYAVIFSRSRVFNLAYDAFRFARQHRLVNSISRSGPPET
jgi:hypothetical protein